MRRDLIHPRVWLLGLGAALVFAAGCASEDYQSFNQNFNQDLPTSPQYVVENVAADHFKIRAHQGAPGDNPERVIYLKQAVTTVAENECHRRGWTNWKLDYIQERNEGWMHVVVAEVWEKPPLTMTPAPSATPPTVIQVQ